MKQHTGVLHFYLKWFILVYITKQCNMTDSLTRLHRCGTWIRTNVHGPCTPSCSPPVMSNEEEYNHVVEAMRSNNIKSVWMGLQRTWLGDFLWLDCTKPVGKFNRQVWNRLENNCAYYNIRDKQIDPGKCSFENKGVLCQAEGCAGCSSLGLHKSKCVHINETCYIKSSFKLSWEKAKIYCQNKGWVMAQFTGFTEDTLVQDIASLLHIPPRASFQEKFVWIGLRREEWLHYGRVLESPSVSVNHWAKGEPSDNKNCSVMEKTSSGYYAWRAATCSSWHRSLCRIGGGKTARTTTAASRNKFTTKPSISPALPESSRKDDKNIELEQADQSSTVEFWTTILVGSIIIMIMISLLIPFYVLTSKNIKGVGKKLYKGLETYWPMQEKDTQRTPSNNNQGQQSTEDPFINKNQDSDNPHDPTLFQ